MAYDDQRVVVWDVGDVEAGEKASKRRVEKARPLRIARAHEGGPIWGLKTLPRAPSSAGSTTTPVPPSRFPPGSFVTAGGDGTARVWHLGGDRDGKGKRNGAERGVISLACARAAPDPARAAAAAAAHAASPARSRATAYADAGGHALLSIAVNPINPREVATGDAAGNVRVFDLASETETARIAAHDSPVLALAFGAWGGGAVSGGAHQGAHQGAHSDAGLLRVVTAGRDRLVRVFDAARPRVPVTTLSDHAGAVLDVVVATRNDGGSARDACVVTTGADESIVFRRVTAGADGDDDATTMQTYNRVVGKTAAGRGGGGNGNVGVVRSLAVAPAPASAGGDVVVGVGADRVLRGWSVASGALRFAHARTAEDASAGEALLTIADATGTLCAVSHADAVVRVYELSSGKKIASLIGHAAVVTVRLLPIRPRSRGARRSLRTFPVVTLHPRFHFNRFNV